MGSHCMLCVATGAPGSQQASAAEQWASSGKMFSCVPTQSSKLSEIQNICIHRCDLWTLKKNAKPTKYSVYCVWSSIIDIFLILRTHLEYNLSSYFARANIGQLCFGETTGGLGQCMAKNVNSLWVGVLRSEGRKGGVSAPRGYNRKCSSQRLQDPRLEQFIWVLEIILFLLVISFSKK